MSRRLELMERLGEVVNQIGSGTGFPVSDAERRQLKTMFDELLRMETEASVSESWQGEVDRQSGAFTDQEILDSQAWK